MSTVLTSSSSPSSLTISYLSSSSCTNISHDGRSSSCSDRTSKSRGLPHIRTQRRCFPSSLAQGSARVFFMQLAAAWRRQQLSKIRGCKSRILETCMPTRGFAQTSVLPAAKSLDRVMMKQLSVQCVIGCNPDERDMLQELVISISVFTDLRKSLGEHVKKCDVLDEMKLRAQSPDWASHAASELAGTHNYSTLAKIARRIAEEGKFFTIEALAECISREVIVECNARRVTVEIDKPAALRKKGARAAAVEITRDREDFIFSSLPETPDHGKAVKQHDAVFHQLSAQHAAATEPIQLHPNVAMIALGSNVGNRPQNIQAALKLLETNKCQLLATSFLYESPASYVTNQPSFVNAACKIATSHGPDELLKVLKVCMSGHPKFCQLIQVLHLQVIEKEVGRQERFRWGPREVDLDILFYNHSVCRQVTLRASSLKLIAGLRER